MRSNAASHPESESTRRDTRSPDARHLPDSASPPPQQQRGGERMTPEEEGLQLPSAGGDYSSHRPTRLSLMLSELRDSADERGQEQQHRVVRREPEVKRPRLMTRRPRGGGVEERGRGGSMSPVGRGRRLETAPHPGRGPPPSERFSEEERIQNRQITTAVQPHRLTRSCSSAREPPAVPSSSSSVVSARGGGQRAAIGPMDPDGRGDRSSPSSSANSGGKPVAQSMNTDRHVDRQRIDALVTQRICKLRTEQQRLEKEEEEENQKKREKEEKNNKGEGEDLTESRVSPPPPGSDAKQWRGVTPLAQTIYEENRRKAEEAHRALEALAGPPGGADETPSDDSARRNAPQTDPAAMRRKLVLHFQRRNRARRQREQASGRRRRRLTEAWERKVERAEKDPRRRAKDGETREYYEKEFPEIRKRRESQERDAAQGQQRGGGGTTTLPGVFVDGASEEQENGEERSQQHRSAAAVPPALLDAEEQQRRVEFIDTNGLMEDPMKVYRDHRQLTGSAWSDREKDTFREKFLQQPKNFGLIASFLERKTVADCVQFYYQSKKSEDYKSAVRKNNRCRGKSLNGKSLNGKSLNTRQQHVKVNGQEEEYTQDRKDAKQVVHKSGVQGPPGVLDGSIGSPAKHEVSPLPPRLAEEV